MADWGRDYIRWAWSILIFQNLRKWSKKSPPTNAGIISKWHRSQMIRAKTVTFSSVLPGTRSPANITLLMKQTRWISCFSLSRGVQFPTSSQSYSNKLLPREVEGIPPSLSYKAFLPQPLVVHSVLKFSSRVVLHGVQCPLDCEYTWLVNFSVSSDQCWVLRVWPSQNPRAGIPPLPKEWIGGNSHRTY